MNFRKGKKKPQKTPIFFLNFFFFFDRRGQSGLERTCLPKEVREKLEKEEELGQFLAELTGSDGSQNRRR